MKKLALIFKNLYVLLIVIILITVVSLSGFLRTYLYETIYNSQIISVFRRQVPNLNTNDFETIESNILKKTKENDTINWEAINNPFKQKKDTTIIEEFVKE